MSSGIYNRLKYNLMTKTIDLVNDTIKIALMNNSHTFTATHNTWSQVSANETSGTGYTTGGVTLANKSVTQGSTTKFDADDPSWSGASFTAYHAVIHDTTIGSDDLLCSLDFGGALTITSGTLTLTFDSAGIITLS